MRLCVLGPLLLLPACAPAAFDVELAPSTDPVPDPFGNGQHGALTLDAGEKAINECHPVAAAGGDQVLLQSSALGSAGGLVFVWQVQDDVAVVGSSATLAALGDAGLWEVTRVESVTGAQLAVAPPLANGYSSSGANRRAQVCTLPEYTSVTVLGSAALVAAPWDGARGGFLGFHANGTVRVDGRLDARGRGFRGAVPLGNGGGNDEQALVNDDPDQAGGIGEGIGGFLALAGRGNAANGGGGGGAFNSGGGGGGNGGRGGRGASQTAPPLNANTFGFGGAALVDATARLFPGGGGGSGHQNDELAGSGGRGGGVVFLRVRRLEGTGSAIDASGADGGAASTSGSFTDGAGGGGAGGSIAIEVEAWAFGGAVRAAGGQGGVVPLSGGTRGVGGGGGGGRAFLPAGAPAPVLDGGAPGENLDQNTYDAAAGDPG